MIPKHVKDLQKLFPSIKIIVQPSTKRCFKDNEYLSSGAIINENISSCDLILGVKEINISNLIHNKKYLFFSHTSKLQPDDSDCNTRHTWYG